MGPELEKQEVNLDYEPIDLVYFFRMRVLYYLTQLYQELGFYD